MATIWNNWTPPPKRKVFVSYYHRGHQGYYDAFSRHFGTQLDLFSDRSLDRARDSDDPTYIMRYIRETHLKGASTLIVLCGSGTDKRKYVDWEIKAALDQRMAVVAVKLPDLIVIGNGCDKPARLQDNIDSGYAVWTWWEDFTSSTETLTAKIEEANKRSKLLITNSRPRRLRNG